MRIGQGYDIHKLIEKKDLILGGVKIPFEKGLLGHSDADVLIHAIIDSLLGAACLDDIGTHFPDSSNEYKDIKSIKLLKKTAQMVKNAGYKIINIDSTIICQSPKLSSYKEEMRKNIAQTLDIKIENVSVKAKTKENMDSTGRGLSIEVFCSSLIDNL
ncbi:MAG: 2-C-methyl-D-erythritol 2,4-cyclodiphosphate synthase [Candidatus Gastranaerophilales bacterium]|nr:2-C-methyl-D-erythritol 2,4-cyclodiphosphate synthase [Candidatus Gastranaerophilales bacterium]